MMPDGELQSVRGGPGPDQPLMKIRQAALTSAPQQAPARRNRTGHAPLNRLSSYGRAPADRWRFLDYDAPDAKFREDIREIAELTSDGRILGWQSLPRCRSRWSIFVAQIRAPAYSSATGSMSLRPRAALCHRLALPPDPAITLHSTR